ncbi:pitrilysin family protein [Nannocystis sp. RBIL2]|uniref:M16 family metallopeptidase n=1 Tax=Nannocystis sp. RBIL2 TaxID=2996788 RepID=UPI00226D7570|nr:pitrilysin family protein [Nannocystis sp. RBIL2]MCY1063914.1 pitrilysin family protein [Nannocystis sp. RBIL2]
MFTRTTNSFATALVVAALAAPGCGKPKGETTPPTDNKPVEGPPVADKPARVYQDPPPPTEPREVQFPDLQKIQTKNGLEIYVVENHEVPLVTAQLVIKAGTMDDEQLAEMTANMLGEGTKTRTKAKIDEEIEFVGGSLGAGAGVHDTSVYTQVLKRDVKLALTLMADEVMNPAFPPAALDKLKEKSKTNLKAMKSNSDVLADQLFDMAAYPSGHPYGRPLPTEAQIDAVTVDAVKKFHDTFYRSNNSYLILSGDITVPEAEKLGNEVFAKWKPIEGQAPANPLNGFKAYKHPPKLIVHLVNRPNSAQSDIRVGNLALARKNPDWIKLDLASTSSAAARPGVCSSTCARRRASPTASTPRWSRASPRAPGGSGPRPRPPPPARCSRPSSATSRRCATPRSRPRSSRTSRVRRSAASR